MVVDRRLALVVIVVVRPVLVVEVDVAKAAAGRVVDVRGCRRERRNIVTFLEGCRRDLRKCRDRRCGHVVVTWLNPQRAQMKQCKSSGARTKETFRREGLAHEIR